MGFEERRHRERGRIGLSEPWRMAHSYGPQLMSSPQIWGAPDIAEIWESTVV